MASPIPQNPSVSVSVAPPVTGSAAPSASSAVIDLDSIPNQIGHAILRSSDGTILRPPSGSLSDQDVVVIYRMMLEIGAVLEGGTGGKEDSFDNKNNNNDDLQRVTVGFKHVSYVVTLGGSDGCMYIVKKKSSL